MIQNQNKKIRLFQYLLFIGIIWLCFSCVNQSNRAIDHLVFRYNEHKNIGSLDPAFSKDIADIKISADKAGRRARRLYNFDFEELSKDVAPPVVQLAKPPSE